MNFGSSRITKWPDPPFERRRWLSFDCGRLAYYAMSRCHRIIINPARGCYVVIWKRCTDSKWRNNATTASDSAAGAMVSLGWPMVLVVVRRRGVSTAVTSGDKPSLRLDRRVYIMARGERGCWSDIFIMSKDNTIWNLVSRVMKCRSYWSHSFDTTL